MMLGYDDGEDILEDIQPHPFPDSSATSAAERFIRKRSSKACDNCRKAKCKCERTATNEPCKNCVLNGQECTFLGPSRKRGPPKGYIDALESRLHQLEALIGSILASISTDPRTRSLIYDLCQNDLAREILNRVDVSPFGRRGRSSPYKNHAGGGSHGRRRDGSSRIATIMEGSEAGGGYSPYEWQDALVKLIGSRPSERSGVDLSSDPLVGGAGGPLYSFNESNPYQRRRHLAPCHSSSSSSPQTPADRHQSLDSAINTIQVRQLKHEEEEDSEADLADEMGQLSINELQQVRYHGKASGLHLLMPAMLDAEDSRSDGEVEDQESARTTPGTIANDSPNDASCLSRSPGDRTGRTGRGRLTKGIWRFPAAGVWPLAASSSPPLPHSRASPVESKLSAAPTLVRKKTSDRNLDDAAEKHLPGRGRQEEYVKLYFAYVHPVLPIVHKAQFMEDFQARADETNFAYTDATERVSNLLLLAMFAITARYSDEDALPEGETMWTAGDIYAEQAQDLLSVIQGSSVIDTVQSLILLGYREIGLGKMERAWLHVGMSVRIAQDLGLHRSIAKYPTSAQEKFTHAEKETRSRVWHACMRMDKYVSTYIGRPVMVSENDYDTPLPEEDEEEENELWVHPPRLVPSGEVGLPISNYVPQPTKVIACFKAATAVSKFTGMIVSNFYSVKPPPPSDRRKARVIIERELEKWHNDLPDHLCYTPHGDDSKVPTPHVIVLHMQYWGAVLLLLRPLLQAPRKQQQSGSPGSTNSAGSEDETTRALQICQTAAHHITNLGTAFSETFCPRRAPAILSYYVFSASIMHVSSLMDDPSDVQARAGLQKAKQVLRSISLVWPSALRAWELLNGVRPDIGNPDPMMLNYPSTSTFTHQDRPAKRLLVDTDAPNLPHSFRSGPPVSAHHSASTSRSPNASVRRQPSASNHSTNTRTTSQRISALSHFGAGPGVGVSSAATSNSFGITGGQRSSQLHLADPKHTSYPSYSAHSTQAAFEVPTLGVESWAAPDHHHPNPLYDSFGTAPDSSQGRQDHLPSVNGFGDQSHHQARSNSIVVPQHVPFEGQFGGSDYQRQSTMDAFFPGSSSSSAREHQPNPATTSSFRQMYQQSHQPPMSDSPQYPPPAPVNNRPDPWHQYNSQGYSESPAILGAALPYEPLSAPPSALMPNQSSMLPPLMLPDDSYGQARQSLISPNPHSSLTDPASAHPHTYGLDHFYGVMSDNTASYLSGPTHGQAGQ